MEIRDIEAPREWEEVPNWIRKATQLLNRRIEGQQVIPHPGGWLIRDPEDPGDSPVKRIDGTMGGTPSGGSGPWSVDAGIDGSWGADTNYYEIDSRSRVAIYQPGLYFGIAEMVLTYGGSTAWTPGNINTAVNWWFDIVGTNIFYTNFTSSAAGDSPVFSHVHQQVTGASVTIPAGALAAGPPSVPTANYKINLPNFGPPSNPLGSYSYGNAVKFGTFAVTNEGSGGTPISETNPATIQFWYSGPSGQPIQGDFTIIQLQPEWPSEATD